MSICKSHHNVLQSLCLYPHCERRLGCRICRQICLDSHHENHTAYDGNKSIETIQWKILLHNYNEGLTSETIFQEEESNRERIQMLIQEMHILPPNQSQITSESYRPQSFLNIIDLNDQQQQVDEISEKSEQQLFISLEYEEHSYGLIMVGDCSLEEKNLHQIDSQFIDRPD